jgi:hypothetical protein
MADRKYYVICDSGCKFESMTKEQILTAITNAVNEGTVGNIDTGFITTIKTVNGKPLKFFFGTQSEYEALTEDERKNLFALITNDTTKEALFSAIESLQREVQNLETMLADGSFVVQNAKNAETATNAVNATNATNAEVAARATTATRLGSHWINIGDIDAGTSYNYPLDSGVYIATWKEMVGEFLYHDIRTELFTYEESKTSAHVYIGEELYYSNTKKFVVSSDRAKVYGLKVLKISNL